MKESIITSQRESGRNINHAFILSLLFTGLGQLYNDEAAKGFIFFFLRLLCILLMPLYAIINTGVSVTFILAINLLNIIIWIYSAIDARLSAKEISSFNIKIYNSVWAYTLFAVLTSAILIMSISTLPSFYGIIHVPDNAMNPSLSAGEFVLVNKYANPEAGDVIIYNNRFSRILAKHGDTAAIFDNKFYINGKELTLTVLSEAEIRGMDIPNSEDLFFEINGSVKYPIKLKLDTATKKKPLKTDIIIKENMLLASPDNRKNEYELIDKKDVAGKAEGIIFSGNIMRITQKLCIK